MKALQMESYPNEAGWYIEQDGETHLFKIRRASGHYMHNSFTSRRFAESHLRNYLETLSRKSREANAVKRNANK